MHAQGTWIRFDVCNSDDDDDDNDDQGSEI